MQTFILTVNREGIAHVYAVQQGLVIAAETRDDHYPLQAVVWAQLTGLEYTPAGELMRGISFAELAQRIRDESVFPGTLSARFVSDQGNFFFEVRVLAAQLEDRAVAVRVPIESVPTDRPPSLERVSRRPSLPPAVQRWVCPSLPPVSDKVG